MGEARLTLRDIARALGVSTSTVSLALRDSPRISTPVRERVKAEAERIGYSTDLAGTLLRTSRPRIIGLLCRLDQDLHFTYHEHILATAAARGYRTVVAGISRSTSAADALVSLRQLRCQALIVIDPGSLGSLGPQTGMPTVVIGQERPFASCDLVTSDNLAGTAEVTDHLVAAGHRAAIYLAGPAGTSARTRRLTLLETARGTPLSVRVVLGGATVDAGFASTLALIERGELIRADAADAAGATVAADAARDGHPRRATALLCYNDQCAQGALVALARRGLSVPDDISVTGFDNTRGAASRAFDLTAAGSRSRRWRWTWRSPGARAGTVLPAVSRCAPGWWRDPPPAPRPAHHERAAGGDRDRAPSASDRSGTRGGSAGAHGRAAPASRPQQGSVTRRASSSL